MFFKIILKKNATKNFKFNKFLIFKNNDIFIKKYLEIKPN